MSKRRKQAAIATSAALGASLGWAVSSYISNKRSLEENQTFIERLKDFEQQLYTDGFEKANDLQGIRQEVENRI
ncbi:hypothetical protein ACFQ4N_16910 [Oceanobacillus iheyensis]|uniref:hypothetical protein n=1 Tax=Oceanobacillus iheyensis TaxID=182710 RepID=UPI003643F664